MKRYFKHVSLVLVLACAMLIGCDISSDGQSLNQNIDKATTLQAADRLVNNQPTPTDIDYSLERYNLIRRAYWVNGQRERAKNYPCEIADVPLGYVVLFAQSGSVIGNFIVEGKVTSLNSYLTPDSEFYEIVYGGTYSKENKWLPDIDGSFGTNDSGIFFFTPDGKYIEWSGEYLYSDIPFEVDEPVLKVSGE